MEEKSSPEKSDLTQKKSDFQGFLLGNVFNKIGAFAIIIAAIIFIKLVSPYIIITPVVKIILGFMAGLAAATGGIYMHSREELKKYSEVLIGTGFAILFITTFCAYSMFNIFNIFQTVGLGALLMFAMYFLADKMKTVSMLVLGLLGGYITTFVVTSDSNVSLGFLIFLNLISLIYSLRNKNCNWINPVNLILTFLIMTVEHLLAPVDVIFPVILWVSYILYDILRDKTSKVDNSLIWINYAVLTFFSLVLSNGNTDVLRCVFAISTVLYIILSALSRFSGNDLYRHYDYGAAVQFWLLVLFAMDDINSIIAWALGGMILTLLVCKFKFEHLKNAVILYYLTLFFGVLTVSYNGTHCLSAVYPPVLNIRTLIFALAAFAMFFSGYTMKKNGVKSCEVLALGSLSLVYIYAAAEISSWFTAAEASQAFIGFNRYMTYVLLGILYSFQLKKLHHDNHYILFNVISIIAGIISMLFLLFGSFSTPQGYVPFLNIRCAVYLAAIASFVLFARWYKSEVYKYIALVLGFFLCNCESLGIVSLYPNLNFVVSLSWILYSGIITIAGIITQKRCLLNSGIIIILLTILRIFTYDLAKVDALYKLIAFLVLGIILMLISYIYTINKTKK